MAKITLALLCGGRSSEREVSLASGREVLANLDPSRYETRVYDPAFDLDKLIKDAPEIEVVFPALHGLYGEDGSVQGFLTLLGLPFVGSGILSSAMAMDKALTKDIYRASGLPTAPDAILSKDKDIEREIARIIDYPGLPLVIKPVDQGSSVGLSLACEPGDLKGSLSKAFLSSERVMAEKLLKGREFTVAVLGNKEPEALPPVEIVPGEGHGFFDYSAKYEPGESEEICPADLSPKETLEIKDLGLRAHLALRCRGLSRTDFILSEGVFYLLETNTLPGLTSQSLIPKAARVYGLSFPALLDRLVDLALEKSD
jgi:D-alanine-D-alanine ligase